VPIRPPSLDDRSFNDLVEELVGRIPAHTPEWRNPRLGDPGRTVIELFAWLTDTLLYRANLIPERQRLAFLRLLGLPMNPAVPAAGMVAIGFDDKSHTSVQVVQAHATVKGPVPFETTTEITVLPVWGEAYYKRPLTDAEAASVHDLLPGLVRLYGITGKPRPYATTPVFPKGVPDPAGFDLTSAVDGALWIALMTQKDNVAAVKGEIGSQAISVGITPALEVPALFEDVGPRGRIPHAWDITTGPAKPGIPAQLTLDVVADSTDGLRRQGVERLLLPRADLIGAPPHDVRLNLSAGVGSAEPPRIDDVEKAEQIVAWLRLTPTVRMETLALSWAGVNAVEIEQRQTFPARIVGQSDGGAHQQFNLPATSVDRETFVLQVEETDVGYISWQAIADFSDAGRDSRVYILDPEAGTVRFGDGVRGRVPEPTRRIRVAAMRAGGGAAGNVAPGSLAGISGLDASRGSVGPGLKVIQTIATSGGADAETLPEAEARIPGVFRNQDRCVTEIDYKHLALQTPGVRLGRVNVLPRFKPQQRRSGVPGVVSVMVLPDKSSVGPPNPVADRPTLEAVHAYLSSRVPVATELYVIGCEYVPVSISIGVTLLDGVSRETVMAQIRAAARLFLWPLAGGGTDLQGWRLGRTVRDRELDVIVARVAGVDTINGVNLFTRRDSNWVVVPKAHGTGPAEIPLELWQLPQLEQVVVVTDADPPATVSASDGRADGGVAVPVVPQVC
jgi:predicted phage baseplate assembly protein